MLILNSYLCEYATRGEGKATLFNIFEDINVSQVPAVVPLFYVVFFIQVEPREIASIGINIIAPNGETIASIPAKETVVPDGDSPFRSWAQFSFIQTEFKQYGEHAVQVILYGEHIQTIPLLVKELK